MGDEIAAALGRAGMDDQLAREVIERPQHRDLLGLPAPAPASPPPTSPRRGRDRDVSAPRSHRRREECCPLRPAVCAVAGAGPPVPPRFPSDVPSACAGAAASGTFFSQGLGQLRTADAHALARFDLGAKAGDRPVAPVGHRFFQQGGDDAQGGFTLRRRRARRDAGLQRCDTAGGEKFGAPVFVPPPFTWTGFYVGVNAGGVWSNGGTSTTVSANGFPIGTDERGSRNSGRRFSG